MSKTSAWKMNVAVGRWAHAVLAVAAVLVMFLCASGCSDQPSGSKGNGGSASSVIPSHSSKMIFGMFLDSSGLGDRGFMDMQYNGLVRGCQKYGAEFVLEQLHEDTLESSVAVLDTLVANGCNAVFCTSYSMKEAMMTAAEKNPGVQFILMDHTLDTYLPNTASATFRVGQASYLAGYLAAAMSDNKVIGVIAGKDVPPIHEFVGGFTAGVGAADKDARIVIRYIEEADPSTIPWNNPTMASRIAQELAEQEKADVFFPVAGASGLGVFNYVKSAGRYAIGVDSDQDYLAEGYILTSAMKRLDVAVERLIAEVAMGRFENKNYLYELKNGGVSLSPMKYTRTIIPQSLLDKVAELEAAIISGDIKVPSSIIVE